jgi:hypothetical protein
VQDDSVPQGVPGSDARQEAGFTPRLSQRALHRPSPVKIVVVGELKRSLSLESAA